MMPRGLDTHSLLEIQQTHFERYDIDQSGTINRSDELMQLSLSLVCKLELRIDADELQEKVNSVDDIEQQRWNFKEFKAWFDPSFLEPKPDAQAPSTPDKETDRIWAIKEANRIIANLGVSPTSQNDDTTAKIDLSAPDLAPTGKSGKAESDNPNGEPKFVSNPLKGYQKPYVPTGNPSAADEEHKEIQEAEASKDVSNESRKNLVFFMLGIILTFIALMGLLCYNWYTMSSDSIDAPAGHLMSALTSSIEELSKRTLKWSQYEINLLRTAAESNQIPGGSVSVPVSCGDVDCSGFTSQLASDPCTLMNVMVGIMTASVHVPFLGVGWEDGSFYAVSRGDDGLFLSAADPQNLLGMGTGWTDYEIDSSTGCWDLSTNRSYGAYEPRGRGWYKHTKATGKTGWGGGTYAIFESGELVVSACTPLYLPGTTTLLGVFLADCPLKEISKTMKLLNPGKSGEAYITEKVGVYDADTEAYLYSTDYLLGASNGSVYDVDTEQRVVPSNSSNSLIQSSYSWLMENGYSDSSTALVTNVSVTHLGEPLSGEAMVSMTPFEDLTGEVQWTMIVVIPVDDYYAFVAPSMWISIGIAGAVICYFPIAMLIMICPSSEPDEHPRAMISKQMCLCVLSGCLLWVWWLVITKVRTDDVVQDAIDRLMQTWSDYLSFTWEEFPFNTEVTIMEYVLGLLPLASNMASSDTAIDMHLFSQLNLAGNMASYSLASYSIGYENGDLSSMVWWCLIGYQNGDPCDDPSLVAAGVRSSSTDLQLVYYGTSDAVSGTSKVRDTGNLLMNANTYSATSTDWYRKAVAAGRISGTRYGHAVAVQASLFPGTTSGSYSGTAQAFYDSSGNLRGVVIAKFVFTGLSNKLKLTMPSDDTQCSTVQQFGEVFAASNSVNIATKSDGLPTYLNVTSSTLDNIASYATDTMREEHNLYDSQNTTTLDGLYLKASRPCGTWKVDYPEVFASTLSNWSNLIVIPRSVYYDSLDKGTELNFVIVLFSFSALLYGVSLAADCTFTQEEEQEEYDNECSETEPLPSANQTVPQEESLKSYYEAVKWYRPHIDMEDKFANAHIHLKGEKIDNLCDDPFSDESLIILAVLEARIMQRVEGWGFDPDTPEFEEAVNSECIQMLDLGSAGIDVMMAQSLETKFGESSWQYVSFVAWWRSNFVFICNSLFIFGAYVDSVWWDVIFLLPYTFYTLHLWYLEHHGRQGKIAGTTVANIAINVMLWVTFAVSFAPSLHDNKWATAVHDLGRPWMLITTVLKFQSAIQLIALAIAAAYQIFLFFFVVIALFGIIANVTFYGEFDQHLGQTLDTFLESFVNMFIFMTSGDNYESLVYQGYRASKWSAIMWVPFSLLGIFVLMSMVVATFETSYDELKDMLGSREVRYRTIAQIFAFQLLSWNSEVCITTTGQIYKPLRERQFASFTKAMIIHLQPRPEPVKPLLLFANRNPVDLDECPIKESVSSTLGDAVRRLFHAVDETSSMQIDFPAFVSSIELSRCVAALSAEPLLASKAMLASSELSIELTKHRLSKTLGSEPKETKRLNTILSFQRESDEQVAAVHAQTVHQMVDLVGITRDFSLEDLDYFVVLFILLHSFVLSLWGSVSDDGRKQIKLFGSFASAIYAVEVAVRIVAMGGFTNFLNDRRGQVYRLQNMVALYLSASGMVATLVKYTWDDMEKIANVIAAMELLRVLITSKGFRGIVYSFVLGLQPIQTFAALLLLVMYMFFIIAHALFRHVENDDGTMGFTTLLDTSLAMYQVFLGAGWGDVMSEAVNATNKAVIWLFFFYVLIVGVLFSNLFVGILISTFQYGEEMQQSQKGEVLLAMYTQCVPHMAPESIAELIPTLGQLSQELHFPMSRFKTKQLAIGGWSFASKVEESDSIEDWAAKTIAIAFRKVVAIRRLVRALKKIHLIKLSTRLTPSNAILDAYDRASRDVDDPIDTTGGLFEMVLHVADALGLSEQDRDRFTGTFKSRLEAFRPFIHRMQRFSKEEKREYVGLAKPENTGIHFAKFVLLIAEGLTTDRLYLNYAHYKN